MVGAEMVGPEIVFSRGFLHWTRVMGHGDESGAVLTCYQVDYGRLNLDKPRYFFEYARIQTLDGHGGR